MRVKICGITNLEDAFNAIECGADALGFVFYEKSPRYIEPMEAKKIIDKLPPFVEKVGLFVEQNIEYIEKISYESHISLAQIHFDVEESFIKNISFPALRVIRAKSKEDIEKFSGTYRLIDAFCEAYGGSGNCLNLQWFDGVDCSKIILAGGLAPDNISEVKKYGFYGVDVSSGVESSKGKKDPKKVKKFIADAKSL